MWKTEISWGGVKCQSETTAKTEKRKAWQKKIRSRKWISFRAKEKWWASKSKTKWKTRVESKKSRVGSFMKRFASEKVNRFRKEAFDRLCFVGGEAVVRKPITYHTYSTTFAPPCAFRDFVVQFPSSITVQQNALLRNGLTQNVCPIWALSACRAHSSALVSEKCHNSSSLIDLHLGFALSFVLWILFVEMLEEKEGNNSKNEIKTS